MALHGLAPVTIGVPEVGSTAAYRLGVPVDTVGDDLAELMIGSHSGR